MCESKVSCVSREGSKYVSCYYTLTWGVVLLVQSVEGGSVDRGCWLIMKQSCPLRDTNH